MNLSQLSSVQLRQLAKLAETKEGLLAKVAQINRQLAAIESNASKPVSTPAPNVAPKRRDKKRAQRGQVKSTILNLLKQGGKGGVTVKEIAGKLGATNNRVYTWFYAARKNMKQIKKLGPGKFAWID